MTVVAATGSGVAHVPVGVDDGYAVVKLVYPDADGSELTLAIPARAARGLRVQSVGGEAMGGYETEGQRFTVSPRLASADPTRVDGFHTSALHRVLVHHALIAAGLGGTSVSLACGLPVQDYYVTGGRNMALIDAKQSSLAQTVSPIGARAPAVIAGARVYPQAIGAYLGVVLSAEGLRVEDYDGRKVAIIDIGGNTTDLAALVSGESPEILADHTRSLKLGVFDVRSRVRASVQSELQVDLDEDALDVILRTGTLDVFGAEANVSEHVDAAVTAVWGDMATRIQEVFGNGSRFARVLLVGGGAALFAKYVAGAYRHTLVPPNPEFANAVGFYRYQRYVAG